MIKTWIWKLFRWGYVNVIWFLSITVSSVNCEFSIILTIVQAFNTNILQGTSCPSKKNAYIVGSTLNWYNCLLLSYIHISPVNLPTFRMEILSSLALLDLLVWDILHRKKWLLHWAKCRKNWIFCLFSQLLTSNLETARILFSIFILSKSSFNFKHNWYEIYRSPKPIGWFGSYGHSKV